MVSPFISLDKSQDGYLSISDITTYTSGQRALTGIMMFWSKDAFAADTNIDQSNADSWTVPVGAQQTINVYGFYCYAWDVLNNVNFAKYGIVWYNGYFYIKTTAGTVNPVTPDTNPALDSTNWKPLVIGQPLTIDALVYTSLTEADIYALCVLSTGQGSPTSISTTALTFIDKDAFVLSKIDCLKWDATVNISCTVVRTRLYNYDHTVLLEGIPADGTTFHIDLSAFGDGSYSFEIAYVIDNNNIDTLTDWLVVTMPILEVCQANTCYTKLFKFVICKCDDPCDTCDDFKAQKHDLMMIRELITTINQMVNLQRSQFIGLYPISQSESDLLSDIGQMIDKLKIVTNRCGLCGGRIDKLDVNC